MELKLEGVGKRFGNRWIIKDVNLRIDGGEVVLVLGSNAAGKSTLLKMIATIYRPTTGSILLDGRNVVKDPKFMRGKVTFVPELPTLIDEISLMDNLRFFARLSGFKGSLMDVVRDYKLDDSRKAVMKLSKGMRQRLSLAVALMKDPDVIVMDEPASGLDRETVQLVLDKIKGFAQDGKIVVVASHDEEDLSKVATRVLVIEDSKVVFDGSIEKVESMRLFDVSVDGEVKTVKEEDLQKLEGYRILRVYGIRESIRRILRGEV